MSNEKDLHIKILDKLPQRNGLANMERYSNRKIRINLVVAIWKQGLSRISDLRALEVKI